MSLFRRPRSPHRSAPSADHQPLEVAHIAHVIGVVGPNASYVCRTLRPVLDLEYELTTEGDGRSIDALVVAGRDAVIVEHARRRMAGVPILVVLPRAAHDDEQLALYRAGADRVVVFDHATVVASHLNALVRRGYRQLAG